MSGMILCLEKRPAAQTGKNPHFFQGFLNLPQQLLLPGLKNCQNRFKVDAPRLDRFPLILFRAAGRSKNLKGAISNVQCLLIEQVLLLIRPKYGRGVIPPNPGPLVSSALLCRMHLAPTRLSTGAMYC